MKKFIFIPVVNFFDLLQKAINSVPPDLYDDYFVIDNSNGNLRPGINIDLKHFTIFPHASNMTYRDTQNAMRRFAINESYDYYSFMHSDGEVLDDSFQRLITMAEAETTASNWGAIFMNYDIVCAYETSAFEDVGEWGDSEWPPQKAGYYLDCDYYRRVRLCGYEIIDVTATTNIAHVISATIRSPQENLIYRQQIGAVQQHYIRKWGGINDHEKFKYPFNIAPQ
jgi:hypothetical protein